GGFDDRLVLERDRELQPFVLHEQPEPDRAARAADLRLVGGAAVGGQRQEDGGEAGGQEEAGTMVGHGTALVGGARSRKRQRAADQSEFDGPLQRVPFSPTTNEIRLSGLFLPGS